MWSTFVQEVQLAIRLRDLSQVEKKITVAKAGQILKITIISLKMTTYK